jgi:hypothetical protein
VENRLINPNKEINNLQPSLYITSSCLISGNKIFKNRASVFECPGDAETFLNETYAHFNIAYPKFHKMDMLCKLGFLATEVLLEGTNHEKNYGETETGLVLSNSYSSLDVDLKYEKTISSGASPALFVYTLPNIVIGEISIRHHFKGENAFFVFRKFDGNFTAGYVSHLFEKQLVKNCICGWVDLFKNNYRALLFLVETVKSDNALAFTAENLNLLNLSDHG